VQHFGQSAFDQTSDDSRVEGAVCDGGAGPMSQIVVPGGDGKAFNVKRFIVRIRICSLLLPK
jgi:hypothetical protein